MRFSRMPLAPSCWLNVRVEHRIQKYYRGIRPPWPAEEYVFGSCIRGYTAVIKNIAACFLRIVLALGRQEYKLMRDGMNFTMFEHCFAIAENEIHIAFDVAVLRDTVGPERTGPARRRMTCFPSTVCLALPAS